MQLIQQFKAIFDESGLPLYLRPYRILVTTASSGLIETLFDAVSLHQLKQFYQQEVPTACCWFGGSRYTNHVRDCTRRIPHSRTTSANITEIPNHRAYVLERDREMPLTHSLSFAR